MTSPYLHPLPTLLACLLSAAAALAQTPVTTAVVGRAGRSDAERVLGLQPRPDQG